MKYFYLITETSFDYYSDYRSDLIIVPIFFDNYLTGSFVLFLLFGEITFNFTTFKCKLQHFVVGSPKFLFQESAAA